MESLTSCVRRFFFVAILRINITSNNFAYFYTFIICHILIFYIHSSTSAFPLSAIERGRKARILFAQGSNIPHLVSAVQCHFSYLHYTTKKATFLLFYRFAASFFSGCFYSLLIFYLSKFIHSPVE